MHVPAERLIRETPSNLGFVQSALDEAFQAISIFGCSSALVLRYGLIAKSEGPLDQRLIVRSIRKSVLSALIGIAVGRGQISLSATLEDLGIDDVDPLSVEEKKASVRNLMMGRSGIYHPALAESPDMIAAKPPRGSKIPGDHWCYNNWDFNALGTIYQRATGRTVYEGFLEDIAAPIGMEDFRLEDGRSMTGDISRHPAYHLSMTARDMAKFGSLYLQDGRWGDTQILPAQWVKDSTTAYSLAERERQGYGYMWWTTGLSGEAEKAHGVRPDPAIPPYRYAAHGYYGQMIYVVPAKELVVVTQAPARDRSKQEWESFWEFLRQVIVAAS